MPPSAHPVPVAPPPWTLKAETYMLLMRMKELPRGVYDPLEKAWENEHDVGTFEGGLGGVMIVRYSGGPVGEL